MTRNHILQQGSRLLEWRASILLDSVRRTLKEGAELNVGLLTPQKLRRGARGCLQLQSGWEMIEIVVNKTRLSVEPGTTVAVVIMNHGTEHFRTSVAGDNRAPLCGMGICFECRVTIDGIPHQRSCTILAEDGMEVATKAEPPA